MGLLWLQRPKPSESKRNSLPRTNGKERPGSLPMMPTPEAPPPDSDKPTNFRHSFHGRSSLSSAPIERSSSRQSIGIVEESQSAEIDRLHRKCASLEAALRRAKEQHAQVSTGDEYDRRASIVGAQHDIKGSQVSHLSLSCEICLCDSLLSCVLCRCWLVTVVWKR